MKSLITIQSVSDIITNSSSEVFVVRSEGDGDELIDWGWIDRNKWEIDMICSVCGLPYPENLSEEGVDSFITAHRDTIQRELIDRQYWWADIEDYYDEDGEHHSGADYVDYVWMEWRH